MGLRLRILSPVMTNASYLGEARTGESVCAECERCVAGVLVLASCVPPNCELLPSSRSEPMLTPVDALETVRPLRRPARPLQLLRESGSTAGMMSVMLRSGADAEGP